MENGLAHESTAVRLVESEPAINDRAFDMLLDRQASLEGEVKTGLKDVVGAIEKAADRMDDAERNRTKWLVLLAIIGVVAYVATSGGDLCVDVWGIKVQTAGCLP